VVSRCPINEPMPLACSSLRAWLTFHGLSQHALVADTGGSFLLGNRPLSIIIGANYRGCGIHTSSNRTSGQLITTFAETSVGCRTNARVDAVRPLNRHGLNSRTARDSGVPVVPLVFNTMYDIALPGLGG
jgi:hypothetical protein